MTDEERKAKRRERGRAWYAANKEKMRAYYAANKKKILARTAAYLAVNRDKVLAQKRASGTAWYAKNKEKRRAYLVATKDKRRASSVAHYAANKEKIRASGAAWYAKNKEKRRASSAAYLAAHSATIKASVEGFASILLKRIRFKASKAGYACGVPLTWIEHEIAKQVEAGTIRVGSPEKSPWYPSIDQLTPGLGYVMGNVAVVPLVWNYAKHTFGEAETKEALRAYLTANP